MSDRISEAELNKMIREASKKDRHRFKKVRAGASVKLA